MKTSAKGIDLICSFEGFRAKAYPDPATGGEPWTVGYGHTSLAGGLQVKKGLVITEQQGRELLAMDLFKFEAAVAKGLKRIPSQNRFDAMVSLCFNIGPGNFAKSSVLRCFNTGEFRAAADAFMRWDKAAGKVMAGLTRRRKAEADLFRA